MKSRRRRRPYALERVRDSVPATGGAGFREQLVLSVIVAVLAFAGGAAGAYVTAQLDMGNWEKQVEYEARKQRLETRSALMERTLKSFNELVVLDAYRRTAESRIASIESPATAAKADDFIFDYAVKVSSAQAELATTVGVDALYFGPKTKAAAKELEKELSSSTPWWNPNEADVQRFFEAMNSEMQYGF